MHLHLCHGWIFESDFGSDILQRTTRVRPLANYLSLLLLGGIVCCGCGSVTGAGTDKRPVDLLTLNQCNREMTALDQQVADMETLLKSDQSAADVLEEAQRIRQEIPAVQLKCTGSDAALTELKKLDQDLGTLMKRLEMEGYR